MRSRAKLVQLIHIAKAQLVMDAESYQAVLQRITNKTSCAKLTEDQLELVLHEMKRLGFKPTSKSHGRRPNVAPSRQALLGKIEALLADAGRSWSYADGLARQMWTNTRAAQHGNAVGIINGVPLEWLDSEQLFKLLQALAVDQKRRIKRSNT